MYLGNTNIPCGLSLTKCHDVVKISPLSVCCEMFMLHHAASLHTKHYIINQETDKLTQGAPNLRTHILKKIFFSVLRKRGKY